jgi:hypothetical protein
MIFNDSFSYSGAKIGICAFYIKIKERKVVFALILRWKSNLSMGDFSQPIEKSMDSGLNKEASRKFKL